MSSKEKEICRSVISLVFTILFIASFVMTNAYEVNAATLKVTLHQSNIIQYDGGRAYTYKKTVTFKKNGKTVTKDAFCLEPRIAIPASKSYNAKQLSDDNKMSKVMYFVDGAPGESDFRAYMKKNKLSSYIDTKNQYYAFMHITLAYAYEGTKAFKIFGGGSLSSKYQSAVKKAYAYCKGFKVTDDASFTVASSGKKTVKAIYDATKNKYTTAGTKFHVTGSKLQSFDFSVPKKTTLYLKQAGKSTYTSYAAGKKVTIKTGAYFYFECDPSISGGFTKNVEGNLGSLTAWKLTATSSTQNLAFFSDSSTEKAKFTVTISAPQKGKVRIKKATKSLLGEIKPESGAKFRIYNKTYGSYEAALKKNTATMKYAAEMTTGTDGSAVSVDLYAGTAAPGNVYVIEQTYSKLGYKLAAPRNVTLKNKETVLSIDENQKYIINEQSPLKIKIKKVDESSNELITSGTAEFAIYKNAECTDKVASIKTTNGIATSDNLDEGVYYIKEISAPAGYDLNPEKMKVTLSYNNAEYDSSDQTYYLTSTVENSQNTTHGLYIFKKAAGGLWDSAYEGKASSEDMEKLKKETFTFNVQFRNLDASKSYSYQIMNINGNSNKTQSFRPDNDGTANVNISINPYFDSNNKCNTPYIVFGNLPSSTKYVVQEKGGKYLGNSTPYTASYAALDGDKPDAQASFKSEKISVTAKSGAPGKGVSTEEETFKNISNTNYNVGYCFTNSTKVQHKLIISKKVVGADANPDEEFKFTINLSNPRIYENTSLKHVIYTKYAIDGDGNKKIIKTGTGQDQSDDDFELDETLKNNEFIEIQGIDPGTAVDITEGASEYIASCKKYAFFSAGTAFKEYANKKAYGPLAVSDYDIFLDNSEEATIRCDFTNTMPDSGDNNKLVVQKNTNDNNNSDAFDFTASLEGLKENSVYAAILTGSKSNADLVQYELNNTSNYGIAVVKHDENAGDAEASDNNSDTESPDDTADPDYVLGVPIDIIRSDGKVKHLTTGTDGILDLEGYIDWIKYKNSASFQIKYADKTIDAELITETGEDGTKEEVVSFNPDDSIVSTNGIVSFKSDDNGNANVSFSLKNGCKAVIGRLPEGAKYSVTEKKNAYSPSYVVERKNTSTKNSPSSILDQDKASARNDLETDKETFKSGSTYTDTVTFNNKINTYDIEVNKQTSDESDKAFDYEVDMDELAEGTYFAVVPGTGTFDITINANGNLQVSQTAGDAVDLKDLPIKITRPDGECIIKRTNSEGLIHANDYVDWLMEGTSQSFDFTVSFLGTDVTMTCNQ